MVRYTGAFPPVLENFCRAFSPGPTDRPWVSEDDSEVTAFSTPPPRPPQPTRPLKEVSKDHFQSYRLFCLLYFRLLFHDP